MSTKQVYLDVCILCRPFDDQQQGRVRLQTAVFNLKQSEGKPVNAVNQHRQWQETLNRDLFYDHVFGATAQTD